MSLEDVKTQLESYADLTKTLEKIHNQGFYSLFQTSFQSLHAQEKSFKTLEFKQHLKIIISELIDTVWTQHHKPDRQSTTRRNDSITPQKSLKKSVTSCSNLKLNYKIPGCAVFTKEKRSVQKEIPVTPGPGDYEVETGRTRSKSPTTVFNKEKRVFEIAHKESPGPSAYSPCPFSQSKL